MITTEGMGHRACKDGTEMDHLTKAHRYYVENHGIRAKIKTGAHRRTRRQVRETLRTGAHEES